jgi:hypothetical protein
MADVDLVEELLEMVERHAQRNAEDIKLARTRDEHVRVTARANEAREIADRIRVITESNN